MDGRSTYNETIPRYAQYGNTLIQADNLAYLRGTGQYNEPPNMDQSTNRGNDYHNALQKYGETNYFMNDRYNKILEYDKYDVTWGNIQRQFDDEDLQNYVVGSTNFHNEDPNAWKKGNVVPGVANMNTYGDNQYVLWAAKSMQLTPNALMNFFFSVDNIEYLQNRIIDEIYNIKGIKINKQSYDEMLIIMRNNYLYALYGWLPVDATKPNDVFERSSVNNNQTNLAYNSNIQGGSSLEYQIVILNQAVLQEYIKQILSGINMYNKYYEDASTLPMPLSHPVLTSMKGSKTLMENIAFESSSELNKAIASYNERYNII